MSVAVARSTPRCEFRWSSRRLRPMSRRRGRGTGDVKQPIGLRLDGVARNWKEETARSAPSPACAHPTGWAICRRAKIPGPVPPTSTISLTASSCTGPIGIVVAAPRETCLWDVATRACTGRAGAAGTVATSSGIALARTLPPGGADVDHRHDLCGQSDRRRWLGVGWSWLLGEEVLDGGGWGGSMEEVSLAGRAPELVQAVVLSLGFHTFGDHRQPQ